MSRHTTVLKVAQDSDLGGHCGVKRTIKKLLPCVTWPNINPNTFVIVALVKGKLYVQNRKLHCIP